MSQKPSIGPLSIQCATQDILSQPGLLEFVMKDSAGVLKPSVTMEQGMGVRIGLNSLVEGSVNERVIIVFAEHIGHNSPVTKVKDST